MCLSIKKLTSFSNPYGCRVPKKDDLSYECVCVWYVVCVYGCRVPKKDDLSYEIGTCVSVTSVC